MLSDDEYVQANGNICPKCKKDLVAGGDLIIDGKEAYQDCSCYSCNYEWTDCYKLRGWFPKYPRVGGSVEQRTLEFDLYDIYDRLMDGVRVKVTIEYDKQSIIDEEGCTNENIKYISSTVGSDPYLTGKPFDLKQIEADLVEFLDVKELEELLAESLDDDEYDEIFPQYAT
jgi:hypothetical protein